MPFINLIAEQRSNRRVQARKVRTWLFAFAGSAAIGTLALGALFVRGEALKGEQRSLEVQVEQLQPLKETISRNETMLMTLAPRVETLTTARLDTERWTRILDHISMSMPPNTWLTNVHASQAAEASDPVNVSWKGMSSEQNLVGELMLRLQRLTDLGNIHLKYTEMKNTAYGNGLEFEIGSVVVGTEESPVRTRRTAT